MSEKDISTTEPLEAMESSSTPPPQIRLRAS